MDPIRLFSILSWIALPTVMFGGYSLLGLHNRADAIWTHRVRPFPRPGGDCWRL